MIYNKFKLVLWFKLVVLIGNNNRNKEPLIVILHLLNMHYKPPTIFFVFVLFNSVSFFSLLFMDNLFYHGSVCHKKLRMQGMLIWKQLLKQKSNIMLECNYCASQHLGSFKKLTDVEAIHVDECLKDNHN